jgi:hypothetical protein
MFFFFAPFVIIQHKYVTNYIVCTTFYYLTQFSLAVFDTQEKKMKLI